MLKKLTIENFAIIDKMQVDFSDGFNVITGETGSGKSLIVNAIDILFGSKLDNEMIRDSSKNLKISGIFKIKDKDIQISRLYSNGKTGSFIDGNKISKAKIIEKSSYLAQFQKQHDSNKLLNQKKHIDLLDNYSVKNEDLQELQNLYFLYINSKKEYDDMMINDSLYKDKFELYNYQLQELDSIDLNQKEELSVNNEYKKHINSKKILDIISIYSKKNQSIDESPIHIVESLSKSLETYKNIDSEIATIVSRLESIKLEFKDVMDDLYGLEKKYYFNLEELETLDSKVQKYEEIKRKYGGTIESAIEHKNRIEKELDGMPSFEQKIENLKKIFAENELKYRKKAAEISAIRHESSIRMSDEINRYLEEMDMSDAKIKINLSKTDTFKENGFDCCEFFAITNRGEVYKPIKKIASGGEISRIMLAINLVVQKMYFAKTLIFDEVDSGISGSTASNIGLLLNKLSQTKQLIIVTHLPQIASKSDNHISVYKADKTSRVISLVKTLNSDEHKFEIARMLSGKKITPHSINQANEMIANG